MGVHRLLVLVKRQHFIQPVKSPLGRIDIADGFRLYLIRVQDRQLTVFINHYCW